MKPGRSREELENALIEPTLQIKRRRTVVEKIKKNLFEKHQIIEGNTQSWINDPESQLSELDWRALFLFAEQVFKNTGETDADPTNYYTEVEEKRARQYMGNLSIQETISLPLVLENVTMLDYDKFVTTIEVKLLARMSSTLLNYNFDIQRESRKIVRGNETIEEATLMMDNVLEIKNHLKNNTLETTTIVINASAGTSDSGNELYYNEKNKTLTIDKGTVLDIVDGYHRCRASELALNEKQDIDFSFIVLILNYTDDQAMRYQGQLAKATPISKTRQKQLSASRHADAIVKKLMGQSELKGRVSTSVTPSLRNKELVSYDVLSDTIEDEFNLNRTIDVHRVGEYLKTFFDMLLGAYEEQFLIDPIKWKRKTVLVENNMFIGYIVLAKRMYEQGIAATEVLNYIEKINFDRENEMWKEIGFLNEKGNLNKIYIARRSIKEFFQNIKI